jgi:hypothetical protein
MPIDDSNVLNCSTKLNPVEVKMAEGPPIYLHHVSDYGNYLFINQKRLRSEFPDLWSKATSALDDTVNDPEHPGKANAAWLACYNLLSEAKLLVE